MDRIADEWVRAHVDPCGSIEIASDEPWATVWRIPIKDGAAWFKACAPVQGFESRLTAALFERWPDRVAEVIAHDTERRWMLLADAGTPLRALGNPPEVWLAVLPRYAELQRGEGARVTEHLRRGVPDLRVATLPSRYDDLLTSDLPLDDEVILRLRRFAPHFAQLCEELDSTGVAPSIQHDDLHAANLYVDRHRIRVLDWGDASIAHPFASLVVTFRFLEETNELRPDDGWFARLRDAYLEVWGHDLAEVFGLAMRVGTIAHAIAWIRQRDALPAHARAAFDQAFTTVLRRAVQQTLE